MRLDQRLVAEGLADSRARAQELVRAGLVRIDGTVSRKPSRATPASARIDVDGVVHPWVSRGGVKLSHAFDHFGVSAEGRVVLDLGASTGGFTQVCLTRGAARVYAVDVGHDQLRPEIASDPRVVPLSGVNAKDLDDRLIPEPVTLLVADLAFISLQKALPAPLRLTAPGAEAALLVKPQFEAGRAQVGRGGVVRDPAARDASVAAVAAFLEAEGWRVLGATPSPILGGDGNEERLLAATRPRGEA